MTRSESETAPIGAPLADVGAPGFGPGDLIDRFLVIDRLGEGGMGVVLRAYDPDLDRKVAIKLLHSDNPDLANEQYQKRLLREAQAMAKLTHPNVVTVHQVGLAKEQIFIVMEYVRGQTMSRWLRSGKRPVREIVEVFKEAGAGLAAAHRAGLVHRDFKPENVLVGTDRRVRVTDFGLVGMSGEAEDISGDLLIDAGASASLSVTITRAGTIIGTPRYMAPEQFQADASDGRTDQFSFCVALYEALFGTQPFKGESYSVLADNTIHGRLVNPPKGVCSTRVRKAIIRGLAIRPEDRHPSMEALIAEFADSPLRRHRLPISAGAIGAIAVVATLIASQRPAGALSVCKRQDTLRNQFWGAEQKESIRTKFAETGLKQAGDSATRTIAGLDSYTEDWLDTRVEACQATHVDRTQSGEVFDLQMACLERRQREVTSLIGQFATDVDVKLVHGAVSALHRLPALTICSKSRVLASAVRVPEDPTLAAEVRALRVRLDELSGIMMAGRYEAAQLLVDDLATDTRGSGYSPLVAEVLLVLGQVAEATGSNAEAESTYYEVVWAAEAGRHDVVAATAWLELLWLIGDKKGHFKESQKIAGHARAAIARIGNPPAMHADYLNHLGNSLYRAKKFEEAIDAYDEAVEIREQLVGADSLEAAILLNNLSAVHRSVGNFEMAAVLGMRSLEIKQRELGANHPRIATAMTNLGIALSQVGQLDLGIEYFQKALEIKRESIGTDNRSYAIGANNLGDALTDAHRFEEALPYYLDSKRAFSIALSPEHELMAYPLAGEGNCLVNMDRHEEAIEPLRQAIELHASDPPDSEEAAAIRFDLAKALWATGKKSEARQTIDLVEAAYANAGDKTQAQLQEIRAWSAEH